jgi:hypothetical protein
VRPCWAHKQNRLRIREPVVLEHVTQPSD